MGYSDNRYGGNDNRYGRDEDRWTRDQSGRWDRERSSYGSWGSERDRDRGYSSRGRDDDDRGYRGRGRDEDDLGFFDRAGDGMRSWFGDDEARSRRDMDERRRERDYRMGGGRDNDWRGSESFGGGFGNQRGWGDDHFDHYRDRDRDRDREQGSDRYADRASSSGGDAADTWGGSGYGGRNDRGRRFDRIDAGHVGSQGAHPMSAPVGGAYGAGAFGGSTARSAAILRNAEDDDHRGGSRGESGGIYDPHYHELRRRQMDELDRDYDEYRREHQSRFEQEFGGWRERRQTQRKHLTRVSEEMEVVGSDGKPLGTVEKVRGDRIILTKSDESAGGVYQSIPCSWIDSVDDKVKINKTAEEATGAWRDEESQRALFERQDQGSEGPHVLNRSFSGTYDDDKNS